jgi:Ser/Thr protein kinase RdoA (MazF antagonist)
VTTHDELQSAAARALSARAADFGLNGSALKLTCLLNPHNFDNFTVQADDGRKRVHVKLAEPGNIRELRTWLKHAERLSERYRAPHALGWLEVPESGHAGIVFEHLPGQPLRDAEITGMLTPLAELFTRLHADAGLAAELHKPEPDSLRQAFSAHARFVAQPVEVARRGQPPFVTAAQMSWMEAEGSALLAFAERFDERPVYAPIHCDMWQENVLVNGEDWYVLDWDDLRPGDPAQDWASLCLMNSIDGDFAEASEWATLDDALSPRVEAYYRNLRFFYCVDAIADWHEATVVPEHTDQVRRDKADQFARWYDNYRRTYG